MRRIALRGLPAGHWRIAALAAAAAAVAGVLLGRAEPLYVAATLGSWTAARIKPVLGLALPPVWVAAMGTELRPILLGLDGPQVRLLDFVFVGCVAAVVGRPRIRRPHAVPALLLSAVAVAAVQVTDASLSAALQLMHQLALGIVAYAVTRFVLATRDLDVVLRVLAVAGLVAAVKALALWVSPFDVLGGPDSLLQAYSRLEPFAFTRRTILIGGDLMVVLGVAAGAALFLDRERRMWLGVALPLLPLLGVLASGTRANLLGAIAGGFTLMVVAGRRHLSPRMAVNVMAAGVIALIVLTWQSAQDPWELIVGRAGSQESRAVSLGFRETEARAVLASLEGRALHGLGLGGTFELDAPGTDPDGNHYAHAWPLWVMLKGGVVALVLVTAAFAAMLGSFLRGPELLAARGMAAVLVAFLVASLAVNKLSLAEGQLVVGTLAAAAVSRSRAGRRPASRARPAPS